MGRRSDAELPVGKTMEAIAIKLARATRAWRFKPGDIAVATGCSLTCYLAPG